MIIALDTETTGVDLRHGAKPFLVTIAREDTSQSWWEWDVDPLTREPIIPPEDLDEIEDEVNRADAIILHNSAFDVKALDTVRPGWGSRWPWKKTRDTTGSAHLLGSSHLKNLTDQAVRYLGVNIEVFERACKTACLEAIRIAKAKGWMIAKKGLPSMPSVKETAWKNDLWIPRQIAKANDLPPDHPWRTVTADYANTDSAVTLALDREHQRLIRLRGLGKLFDEKMKWFPIAYKMAEVGITYNQDELESLSKKYTEESEEAAKACVDIAASYGHELTLPKSGNNDNLRKLVFDVMGMEEVKHSEKTGEPSLDKDVIEHYLVNYDDDTKPYKFFTTLQAKRKRDTSISYMAGYTRFCRGVPGSRWYRLHPSLNPNGSDTLRWTCKNPNEQNISKKGMYEGDSMTLRSIFGPAPGREWWKFDAKNIELRLPAYAAVEKDMIALFERPDEPPFYGSNHILNFSIVYPDLWEDVISKVGYEKAAAWIKENYDADWYQYCKNGGFAVQYNAGDATADRAFHRKGSRARLKSRFAAIERYNQWCIQFAERHGYVETMPDKTVDPHHGYPLLCTRTEYGKILTTVPLNYRIQGTAMWWMGKAMVRCDEYLTMINSTEPADRQYVMVMQVHDELVFDFPKGEGPEPWKTNLPRARRIRRLMEQGGDDIGIPTPVSMSYHDRSWSKGLTL